MDFGLSEEQRRLKDTLRRFLADHCSSVRVREVMASDDGHDRELWNGLAQLGVGGLLVPESHGGLGGELLDAALVAEELGYAAAPGPLLGTTMATLAVVEGDDAAAQQRWLGRLASGECLATVAIGEDGSEWRPAHFAGRVTSGRLSGAKPLVPYAGLAEFLVVAAADDEGPGLWLVDAEAEGIECARLEVNDQTRRLDAVTFADVEATRLGGAALLERVVSAGLVLVAADAYGGASRCLEMTRSYVLEREQFGQAIGGFQAVKHQLADMVAALEPSLSLWWYSAHAFDHIKDQAPRHAAMAKAHLSCVFEDIVRQATELHGGIGFTWEFDLHLWLRRALFDRSFLGDAALLRARAAQLAGW